MKLFLFPSQVVTRSTGPGSKRVNTLGRRFQSRPPARARVGHGPAAGRSPQATRPPGGATHRRRLSSARKLAGPIHRKITTPIIRIEAAIGDDRPRALAGDRRAPHTPEPPWGVVTVTARAPGSSDRIPESIQLPLNRDLAPNLDHLIDRQPEEIGHLVRVSFHRGEKAFLPFWQSLPICARNDRFAAHIIGHVIQKNVQPFSFASLRTAGISGRSMKPK